MSEQDKRDEVMPLDHLLSGGPGPLFGAGWEAGIVQQRDADWQVHEALRRRMTEVRRRAIHDFYDGTSQGAGHWEACRLCDWVWKYGGAALHEPSCPVGEETL